MRVERRFEPDERRMLAALRLLLKARPESQGTPTDGPLGGANRNEETNDRKGKGPGIHPGLPL